MTWTLEDSWLTPSPYIARNRESISPLVTLNWQVFRLGEQFVAFVAEPEMPTKRRPS